MRTLKANGLHPLLKRFTIPCVLGIYLIASLGSLSAFPAKAQADQSFAAPAGWAQGFTIRQSWGAENPRMLADVDGDGRKDIVGFGSDGVWLGLSSGAGFSPRFVLADLGYNSGWRVQQHLRLVGDINGDRRADIVAFGQSGVYTAVSTGLGFVMTNSGITDFGYDQGWRVDKHVRLLADVNGDGRQDILAFGADGVWLALATGRGGFSRPSFVLANFGSNQGWNPSSHIRTTGDVNGDGRQDIVGFGNDGVWVAFSNGNGFSAPFLALRGFGANAGSWRVDRHPRFLVDLHNDGRDDIVGFGDEGVWVAASTRTGFGLMRLALTDFGYNSGWRVEQHPRFIEDLNGDGYKDIVGYGQSSVYRALGTGSGFTPTRGVLRELVAERYPFNTSNASRIAPRFVADVDRNGTADLIAFDQADVKVAKSSSLPPPPPPAAPTNLRFTSATDSSLSIAWNDNSTDERRFFIYFGSPTGFPTTAAVGANRTSFTAGSLKPKTEYCFSVQAENLFDISAVSPRICRSTEKRIQTTTMNMQREPTTGGYIPYKGVFGPIFDGAIVTKIHFSTSFGAVRLLKPGRSTADCGNTDAYVEVHGTMTDAQKTFVWGTARPTISGTATLGFVGCTTDANAPSFHPVEITWEQP